LKFRYQPADKLGKLLRGRKDTFAPAVSRLRGRAPPSPPRFRRLWVFSGAVELFFEQCLSPPPEKRARTLMQKYFGVNN